MRADAASWILPLARFNDNAEIERRLSEAPPHKRGGLGNALRYLYVDDGPVNLQLPRFREAEPFLEPVELRAVRWMRTRTNGNGRRIYGTASIVAARTARFRCEDCGHADVRTLQIDHVDGRHGESALRCLCANCHQIKSTADSERRNALRQAAQAGIQSGSTGP